MAVFDEDAGAAPARRTAHEIGQELSALSVEELGHRIALLKEEILRLEREASAKSAQMSAADLLFRR
ncbi:DUF1192 domain-containing protein [Hansschlegelia plantiphila]|uniref:DUF1192 domain-containing protein n=1 Tax=Hansschlegelia plantiphila TaxID=374655 RepID=A0A9W6IZ67_9HYPH|nr:DUF1192 domain-containing protein [Hansschlegelia plantiphila]GLK67861.1 hypothetical protein GCM10008179_14990 [Hansschlegelia plantiphila]